ncbi:MAG: hypothetical protein IK118_04975 [Clostridia bacterium]|nr:hypothetical protein [Clostridia bacterium]
MKKENKKKPVSVPQERKRDAAGKDGRAKRASSSVGYYDFTPYYPAEQQADGIYFRNDAPKRFSPRQKLLIAAAAIFVFCAAFTICRVMLHISEKQPGAIGDAPVWEVEETASPPEIVTVPPGDG